uniref:Uncharacterized protein n=1 Tax=Arion vulgaris TaxID=1028688 RepID=A0A0B7BNH3_9EUPU
MNRTGGCGDGSDAPSRNHNQKYTSLEPMGLVEIKKSIWRRTLEEEVQVIRSVVDRTDIHQLVSAQNRGNKLVW